MQIPPIRITNRQHLQRGPQPRDHKLPETLKFAALTGSNQQVIAIHGRGHPLICCGCGAFLPRSWLARGSGRWGKKQAKRKSRRKQGVPPGPSQSNDLGFFSDAADTGEEKEFDGELLRHGVAMIHQWRNYPDSMKEVAQQLQDQIHEKHVRLQGTVTTLKNVTADCAAYATAGSSTGGQPSGFEVEHFSAQAKLSKLEKACQKSEAQLMRVSALAAALAEGVQAVADAVLNYSDLT